MRLKKILLFIFIFIVILLCSYFLFSVWGDEVWNYGYAYNISRGLVPYKDFGMIVTPFYSFVLAFFILLFGHHFYVMYFLNSCLITIIIFMLYKKMNIRIIYIFPFILLLFFNGYNLLSTFFCLLLLVLFDSNFKNKDFVFGLIVGLMILTKQTVGCCVFIPIFFLSKNKFKCLIGTMIPCLLFLIYLLFNNCFYQFFDYCFFGMFDFTGGNKYLVFLPMEILLISVLIYLYKSKKVDNSVFIVLAFQIIVAPIFDIIHFLLGFLPFIFFLLWKFKFNYFLKFLFWGFGFFVLAFSLDVSNYVMDNSSYLYGKSIACDYFFVKFLSDSYTNSLKNYSNVFVFSDGTYLSKMNVNHTLNKYDNINDGNMGYHGDDRYIKEIDEICSYEKCSFIVDTIYIKAINGEKRLHDTNQTSLKIIKYVYNNYDLVGREYGFDFYSN